LHKEDARKMLFILHEIDFETKMTKGKGATISALMSYARGMQLPIMKFGELIDVFIKAGVIHQKLIGKRWYYRLGEGKKENEND